jgi:hypothetical protein
MDHQREETPALNPNTVPEPLLPPLAIVDDRNDNPDYACWADEFFGPDDEIQHNDHAE